MEFFCAIPLASLTAWFDWELDLLAGLSALLTKWLASLAALLAWLSGLAG